MGEGHGRIIRTNPVLGRRNNWCVCREMHRCRKEDSAGPPRHDPLMTLHGRSCSPPLRNSLVACNVPVASVVAEAEIWTAELKEAGILLPGVRQASH